MESTERAADPRYFQDISTARLELKYKIACDYIQYLRDEVARELLSRSTTPMTEIKRYKNAYGGNYDEMAQDPQGKWVRWEDVEDLLEQLKTLEHDEEIRRIQPSWAGRYNTPPP